jgi:hypothetical protein
MTGRARKIAHIIRCVHNFLILLAIAVLAMTVRTAGKVAEDKWLERKARSGWIPSAVKVITGSQPGFPRRWRRVMTRVSPGRLECRGIYLRRWSGSIEVTAAARRSRRPSFWELLRQSASPYYLNVIEIETATSTLYWTVPFQQAARAISGIRG